MLSKFRRPNHATVVAYLALFVAMSGTAYAAARFTGAHIVDESLTGADIKNATIAQEDLGLDSVDGPRVLDNSLTGDDLNESALGEVPVATQADSAGQLGGRAAGDYLGATREFAVRFSPSSGPWERVSGPGGVVVQVEENTGCLLMVRLAEGGKGSINWFEVTRESGYAAVKPFARRDTSSAVVGFIRSGGLPVSGQAIAYDEVHNRVVTIAFSMFSVPETEDCEVVGTMSSGSG